MTSINIKANGSIVASTLSGKITSGMVGLDVHIEYDDQWAGLNKTAFFRSGDFVRKREAVGAYTTVPWEVLRKHGKPLQIGLEGRDVDGNIVMPTVWATVGTIFQGAQGNVPAAPNPSTGENEPTGGAVIDDSQASLSTTWSSKKIGDMFDRTAEGAQSNLENAMHEVRHDLGLKVESVNGISPDENGNVQIPTGGGSAEGAVLYTEQNLTDGQKAQARANIGAMELAYEVDYRGNMLPLDMVENTYTKNGVTIDHENGVFTLNGTVTESTSIELITRGTPYAMTEAGAAYTTALVYLSGNKTGDLNLFCSNGHEVYMKQNATAKTGKTPAEGYAIDRFAFNTLIGVVFENFKVAPYMGLTKNFVDSYAGGVKKQIDVATAESVAELESKINLLPTRFVDERNRVVPIVQGYNADLRLIVFGDPHSFDENKYRKYNDLLSSGCIDSIVGLGDYQSYSVHERAATISNITKALSHAGRTPNCFYAIGNHDIAFTSPNSGAVTQDTVLTKKEMYDCTCRHLNGVANYNDADPYGGYYYVDYTASKIRIIVLNTSDIYEADGSLAYKYTESVMVQQPQITWLVEKALDFSGKTGWSVLVCCHSAFIRIMLTDILSAVKSRASLNKTWTFDRRLEEGADSVTITANKDFSGQGAVDVIGVLYGHDHHDITTIASGIPFVGFISDNGKLDDYYVAKVNGLPAGSYCFTAANGSKFGFTLSEAVTDAAVFGYNNYLVSTGNTTIRIQNADGITVKELRAKTADYAAGMTEITGFVQERTPGTIAEESCMIVNINKDAREIRIVPYGVGENRVISY